MSRKQRFIVTLEIKDDDQTDPEDSRDIIEVALRIGFNKQDQVYGDPEFPWPDKFTVEEEKDEPRT